MRDLANVNDSELHRIINAPLADYSDAERNAARQELSLRGSLNTKKYSVNNRTQKSALFAFTVGIVLWAVSYFAAEIQFNYATTGMRQGATQISSIVLIFAYIVGIITVIVTVSKWKLRYNWLYIIVGFLLTKWVLIGLGIYGLSKLGDREV